MYVTFFSFWENHFFNLKDLTGSYKHSNIDWFSIIEVFQII